MLASIGISIFCFCFKSLLMSFINIEYNCLIFISSKIYDEFKCSFIIMIRTF